MTLVRSVAMTMFGLRSMNDDVHESVWLREAPCVRRASAVANMRAWIQTSRAHDLPGIVSFMFCLLVVGSTICQG